MIDDHDNAGQAQPDENGPGNTESTQMSDTAAMLLTTFHAAAAALGAVAEGMQDGKRDRPVFFEPDDIGQSIVLKEGETLHSLEEFQTRPNRIRNKLTVTRLESLLDYVLHFRSWPESRAYVHEAESWINVILDGHQHQVAPEWCEHTAKFQARFTPEYKAWRDICAKGGLTQTVFGEFLEDHLDEIVSPEPARVMEAIMSIQVLRSVEFTKAVRLDNGTIQFGYMERDDAPGSGAIELAREWVLRLSVYEGEEAQEVRLRLKYRLEGPKLTLVPELVKRERTERDAFGRMVQRFTEVWMGEGEPTVGTAYCKPHYVG